MKKTYLKEVYFDSRKSYESFATGKECKLGTVKNIILTNQFVDILVSRGDNEEDINIRYNLNAIEKIVYVTVKDTRIIRN